MDNLIAIDERRMKKCSIVLIQGENSEIRCVKLSPENERKFNRNIQADLRLLWDLYDSDPSNFRIQY